MPMTIVFAGSPEIASPALRAVVEAGYTVAAVLTNPDTAKGRSGSLLPTPVACCAERIGLPVIKSASVDGGVVDRVRRLSPDLLVTFAYGALFPPEFLALFPRGGINCHPSLLPRYRGAAPIQETILRRDSVTGITIQYLAEKMDSGDIIACEELPLHGRETVESLGSVAAARGAALLVETVRRIAKGPVARMRQDEAKASYCGKIGKEHGRIDWSNPAPAIDARIRAFTPWPLCQTRAAGRELLILEAHSTEPVVFTAPPAAKGGPGLVIGVDKKEGILIQTGRGVLAATRLQWKAKKALRFSDFLNGAKNFIGITLE
jgi:methionyl-tRNA formyltransferase